MATFRIPGNASLAALAAVGLSSAPAQALIDQAVVSRVGVDGPGCGAPSTPCRTLQVAHDNVVAGGEIDVRDSGDFGPVVISKSISIVNDSAGDANVQQTGAGASAITINAGATGVVHLRGLSIDGRGAGAFGIRLNSGASLDIVDCVVRRFTNSGIILLPAAFSKFLIAKTVASDNALYGVYIRPSASMLGTIDGSTFSNNASYGVYVYGGFAPVTERVFVSVVESAALGNSHGFNATSVAGQAPTKLALNGATASTNNYGVVAGVNSQISLAHSLVSGNNNAGALVNGGSTIFTLGDNSFRLNGADVIGGGLTAYAPK